jgi:DNA-binding CsgD family transcriptional regulator
LTPSGQRACLTGASASSRRAPREGSRFLLVGRSSESAALDAAVRAARDGLSAALVVRGEAGVGKTALLDEVARRADALRVLHITGVEAEAQLGFAGLHRLLRTFAPRLDALPKPQRAALEAAFGVVASAPPDRFLVGLATLTLLADAAREGALLCIIDDVQWIDHDSAEILAFVARRLYADGITMLFGLREAAESELSLEGIESLEIAGLTVDEGVKLLGSLVGDRIDAGVSRRIATETAGNPLAITGIAGELSTEQLSGRVPLPDPLPLGGRLYEAFAARLRALPLASRMLLLVAAADATGDPVCVAAAAASLDAGEAIYETDLIDHLVVLEPRVRFRHPLVRSAVYTTASDHDRRRAHAALADALDELHDSVNGPAASAWHRAAAAVGPDDVIAAALEDAADRELERGGFGAVVSLYARAAALTAGRTARVRRLLRASEVALTAGRPRQASHLVHEAEGAHPVGVELAHSGRLRGLVDSVLGPISAAPARLLAAARGYEEFDLSIALETYLEAFEAAMVTRHVAENTSLEEVARRALSAPRPQIASERPGDLFLEGLATRVAVGYPQSVPLLRAALDAFSDANAFVEGNARLSNLAAFASQELWDERAMRRVLTALLRRERARGALDALRYTLVSYATAELHAGRFDDAEAAHIEASEIASAIDGRGFDWRLVSAEVLAWRGVEADCRAICGMLIDYVAAGGAGTVGWLARSSLVTLEIGLGQFGDALAHAQQLYAEDPLAFGTQVLPSLVEAAVRAGDPEWVADGMARLRERAEASGTPWALGVLSRSEALTSRGDEADELYRDALARLAETDVAVEVARTHLLYGEWLHQQRRGAGAREQLRIALASFDAMGARAFSARARSELIATGEHVAVASSARTHELTAQERRVATLAAGGATNAEIGAQLFISPNTVDYHLRKCYRKLGITSRRQLDRALVATVAPG